MAASPVAVATRNADLAVLAVALPVFLLADLPIAGYLAATAAWLVGRAVKLGSERRATQLLAAGDRQAALRPQAIGTLTRVWIVTGAVLITGLIDRESGLAAAVLAAVLFTVYLLGLFLYRFLDSTAGS